MTDLFSLSVNAMNSDLDTLNVIAGNIANVETVGYKRRMPISEGVQFDRVLNGIELQQNSGVGIRTDRSSGAAIKTGNPLDIMIEGDGWLEITKNGVVAYTRAGELKLDDSGTLITQNGWEVNSEAGNIRLGTIEPRILPNGEMWDGETNVGKLKLVRIKSEIVPVGNGIVTTRNPSEVYDVAENSEINVRQGFVENSNVNTMNEMLGMMETVRHFELMQRFVTAYDGLLDTTITKLGQI